MRKGFYLSVPSSDAEKQPWFNNEKHGYSTSSPLIYSTNNRESWFSTTSWVQCFMSARQKEKSTRKSLSRSRTKLIKLLCTLLFCTASMFFIHRFIHNHIKFDVSNETAHDLFKSIPSSDHIKHHFLEITRTDRIAGSPSDKKLAEWTRDKFIEYGVTDTLIETYYPLLNYPNTTRLSILNSHYEANLDTDLFHAYSGNGNVTGSVVYVNYGRLTDFQFLATRGIQFNGTIALIRLGLINQGLKVKMAQDFGCIGVLLYQDPEEQETNASDLVQQGSVMYSSFIVGDPLSQGYAATKNATRITYEEATGIPKISSLPISWRDALAMLSITEGLGIQADLTWLGGLCNVRYFSGPSIQQVNLVNLNNYQVKPIWNVVGKIVGDVEPEKSIILGNHRDAWHVGAMDPSSGSAVLMELVRTLGVLLNRGWKPRRTIIIASWDAKEYGSVGSTEWVEDHQSWLQEEATAYLNVDYAVSGKHFNAQSSPLLNQLIYGVTKQVIDPFTSLSVYDAWKLDTSPSQSEQDFYFESSPYDNISPLPLTDMLNTDDDTTAFFQYLGISSISFGFRGEKEQHVRKTRKDTVENMYSIDPTFEYHQTLTKIWGLLVLELSSTILLPMHTQDYTIEITRYLNRLSARQGCSSFPFISSTLRSLSTSSLHFDKKRDGYAKQIEKRKHISKKLLKKASRMNQRLMEFERSLIDPLGSSQDRPLFKHVVFGSQLDTGKPQAFPGLAQAVGGDDALHIKMVEERIGKLLINADRILQGQIDDYDDDDDDDEEEEEEGLH